MRVKKIFRPYSVPLRLRGATQVDQDTVVMVRPDGKRLILEPEDSFAQEVTMLGQSETFMAFLAERAQEQGGVSLEEFERNLEAAEHQTNTPDAPSKNE